MIDFFMAGTVVDAAGQFNRRTPCAVKACNHFLMREMRTQDSVKNYISYKIVSYTLMKHLNKAGAWQWI
jgi:ribosomal protein L31E